MFCSPSTRRAYVDGGMTVRRWCLYLLTLAVAAGFYIIYPLWFSWYLLVLTLLFPVFDLAVSLPGMLTRRVALSAPLELEQGKPGALTITALSAKSFPAGRIAARLRERGDGWSTKRFVRCAGLRGSRCEMEIDASHSGVTVFELSRLWVSSLMGLFYLPVSVSCRAAVLVLPTPVKPPNTASLPRGGTLVPKPGGGFAEEHDIRPYRQGDPVNSVHWKLSAKHDELIIREALMAPPHSRLVQCSPWSSPEERDLILGRLRWMSEYLLGHDCPHYVRLGESGHIAEISGPGDLTDFLRRALDNSPSSALVPAALPARFKWVFQADAREGAQ